MAVEGRKRVHACMQCARIRLVTNFSSSASPNQVIFKIKAQKIAEKNSITIFFLSFLVYILNNNNIISRITSLGNLLLVVVIVVFLPSSRIYK